jgi:organic radical activating enzyme
LLQVDRELITALHARGFWIAVETNGTVAVPEGIDWVCVSPKADAKLVVTAGDELKVVYPQAKDPNDYLGLEFKHFFIQPMDGVDARASLTAAIEFCQRNPVWRLSLQTHKMIGIR